MSLRLGSLRLLQASREEAAIQERHIEYFLRLAEEAEPHLYSPKRDSWLERLESEEANLRVAWCEAKQDRVETGLRLAGALALYWFVRGSLQEGRIWLEALLARTTSSDRSVVRGRALYGAGMLAYFAGDFAAASPYAEESVSIEHEEGDKRLIAYPGVSLGLVRVYQGDSEAARSLFAESQRLFKELGDAWGEALALFTLGSAAYRSGDLATARAHLEESLRSFQAQGDVLYASMVLSTAVTNSSCLAPSSYTSQADIPYTEQSVQEVLKPPVPSLLFLSDGGTIRANLRIKIFPSFVAH